MYRKWMPRLRKILFWIGMPFLIIIILITTPYLSKILLWQMNHIAYPLNATAAKSLQGNLSSVLHTEPGSPAWLASNAESTILSDDFLVDTNKENLKDRLDFFAISESDANQLDTLMTQNYTVEHGEIIESATQLLSPPELTRHEKDSEGINETKKPQVIVVLGGGLAQNAQHHIVANSFSKMRLLTAISKQKKTGLPILLSGAEAPYMQQWLQSQGASALFKESHSMNTCENARFTALLLQKHGGAPVVALVTDAWHMPRARRLFAENGIQIEPVIAPLPHYQSAIWPNRNVLMASRRSIYESIANLRDYFFGDNNCREIP